MNHISNFIVWFDSAKWSTESTQTMHFAIFSCTAKKEGNS